MSDLKDASAVILPFSHRFDVEILKILLSSLTLTPLTLMANACFARMSRAPSLEIASAPISGWMRIICFGGSGDRRFGVDKNSLVKAKLI